MPWHHYTLLHTKYQSSEPYDLGEEDFLCVFPIVSIEGSGIDAIKSKVPT